MRAYHLTLGLPHTSHQGLAEHALLMHAGHLQWTAMSERLGTPLSALRDAAGEPVYATFYFVDERFPDHALPNTYRVDDQITLAVALRAFKNLAIEGRIVLDHTARLADTLAAAVDASRPIDSHPSIRFGNIFITPQAGNRRLKVAPPVNADFRQFAPLPDAENPYHVVKRAAESGRLELLDGAWECVDASPAFAAAYAIDPDRDSNGAGLVYFANYVAVMDAAERAAMRTNSRHLFTEDQVVHRVVQARRIAYYGNAALDDRLVTRVSLFRRADDGRRFGVRCTVNRQEDGAMVCLAEAIKILVGSDR